jgi:DNA polymerase-1
MSELEANGIRVDVKRILHTQRQIQNRIDEGTGKLQRSKVYKAWKKKYGSRTNLNSRAQLAEVLFKVMKLAPTKHTATRAQVSEDVLEQLGLPFTDKYLRLEKLKKAKNTYLKNLLREAVDGFMHPNFNLHLARTYRSSSSHPNFQNIPLRDPFIKKLIRRCIIARPGRCLVDLDFKGSEINAGAWYHKDPVMLDYIKTDPGRMHYDVAKDCYLLSDNQMTNDIRYSAKNKFVFPQFYGDWYINCAHNLWMAIKQLQLKTAQGLPLYGWLKRKGITELGDLNSKESPKPGTFEEHISDVEARFWYERFNTYRQWKEEWWKLFRQRGRLKMLTGFEVSGYIGRKEAINYPIQGTAFHCLLWCLIRISKLLKKYNMKTLLVGQIHDSALSDTPENELDDYIEIAMKVITVDLKKHWPWIITPIRAEVEVTPIGGSWYEKEKYKITN